MVKFFVLHGRHSEVVWVDGGYSKRRALTTENVIHILTLEWATGHYD